MIARIAPTPSGYLHWGNLYNFALTAALARDRGGRLGLRIDDVDASRMRAEFVDDVFATLAWLGFEWSLGPRDGAEFAREFSQGSRRREYFAALSALPTYACDCSRKAIQVRMGGDAPAAVEAGGNYDGHCRARGLAFEPGRTALRVALPGFPDTAVWTREDRPAYHWASIRDDLRMGTTDLVRGEDLRRSSAIQRAIAARAGFGAYAGIRHFFHPLLADAAGVKLSKSAGAESLRARRLAGASADEVWRELARRIDVPGDPGDLVAFARAHTARFPDRPTEG